MKNQNTKFRFTIKFNRTQKIIFIFQCIILIFLLYCLYNPLNSISKPLFLSYFEYKAHTFQNDSIILNISNYCLSQPDKITCVWENVPYTYNDQREEQTFNRHTILTPKEYFDSGGYGVCRDNAVIIKSILNNLNINSSYVMLIHHIYVVAYTNNKIYSFNTGLYEYNSMEEFKKYEK